MRALSGNPLVSPALLTHLTYTQRVMGEVLLLRDEKPRDIWDQHAEILDAICSRDLGVDNLWQFQVLRLATAGDDTVVELGVEPTQAPVLRWHGRPAPGLPLRAGGRITVAVRAESISPCAREQTPSATLPEDAWTLPATLKSLRCEGPLWRWQCTLPWGMQAEVFTLPEALRRLELRAGDPLSLRIPLSDTHLLADDGA